jgi:hypothetical protein
MTSSIPHIKLEDLQSELSGERAQLLKDANTKLGYRTNHPLLSQLATLGIAPFRTSAVSHYMKDRETTTMYSGTRNWLTWEAINVSLAISMSWIITNYIGWRENVAIGVAIATGVSTLVSLIIMDELIGCGTRTRWSWSTVPIASFTESIPDYVLAKALVIKEAIPTCELRITSLVSSTEKRHPDPFLSVALGKEHYYVEQWDEQDLPHLDV